MKKEKYIKWSSSYNIGIPHLDEQHQKWLDILNEFHDAVRKGQGPLVVTETLKKFYDYTEYHFTDEEKLMTRFCYPNFESHIRVHKKIIWEISHLLHDFERQKLITSMKTFEMLKDWLIVHILGLDREFGDYAKSTNQLNESM